MSFPIPDQSVLVASLNTGGTSLQNPIEVIYAKRDPGNNDKNYAIGSFWINSLTPQSFQLVGFSAGLPVWESGGNAYATTSEPGIVQLASDVAADAIAHPTYVADVFLMKQYVDATASFGAPIASEVTQGIGYVSSDANALARTANVPGVSAYFVTPTNLDPILANMSGHPIGSTSAGPATFTALTADGTGAVSLASSTAGNFTVATGDLTLQSTLGSVPIIAGEAAADAVSIQAASGGLDVDVALQMSLISSQNAASAVVINASAGGIDITAAGGGANEDIDITNTAGKVIVTTGANASQSIYLHANAGTSETIQLHSDQGTAVNSINILSDVGGITLTSGLASADSFNIASSGGVDVDGAGEINITSSQAAATALHFVASDAAGGITVTTGTGGFLPTTSGKFTVISTDNAAQAIELHANGGTSETIRLRADQGTAATSIDLLSDVGGITLNGGLASASAINLNASAVGGGMSLNSGTAGVTLVNTGKISLAGSLASDITVTGAAVDLTLSTVGGSLNLLASQAASDAVVINASDAVGGVQIQAGTGGVLIGDQVDCTTIDVGNIAPTATRTITVGGGTIVTAAVTDTINVATGGATTNANSIKTVNVNTGGVTLGQVLTNIATGAVTSGTHTTAIATGNRAAGTMAVNLLTGTGTKTLNVGNADGLSTSNILGPVNINVNQNNNVAINSGTSNGSITIGNTSAGAVVLNSASTIAIGDASAGAITVDTAAGISLDGATASNFTVTGASQDLTLSSAGGSVNITATEAAANAIVLNAIDAAGGIDITTGGGSVDISSAGFVTMLPVSDTQASPSDTSVLNVNVGAATFSGFTTAAAASQTFIITNSVVTTASVVFVSVCNEGANDAQLEITRVKRFSGSLTVTVKNVGAASLNGNVTVSFWVIKA